MQRGSRDYQMMKLNHTSKLGHAANSSASIWRAALFFGIFPSLT